MFNNYFMQEALKLAQQAYNNNEVPVGAIIVNKSNNKIIAKAYNSMQKNKNPLMHAEIIAINKACNKLQQKYLYNCDIYVTLEPCLMCATAISYAKINSIFYAASDFKQGAIENGPKIFNNTSFLYKPEIYNHISEELSITLLKKFFLQKRKLEKLNK